MTSEWIDVDLIPPPKNIPFLSLDEGYIDIVIWVEPIKEFKGGTFKTEGGWFKVFSNSCNCCAGHCSSKPDFWMPLPEPPKEIV